METIGVVAIVFGFYIVVIVLFAASNQKLAQQAVKGLVELLKRIF
jgi:hypothetical protein